ncbi:cytochrome P450 [Plantactinospora sp. WMMB334]|uniref:cytochrome P450 n=1 Tax=Plantactinospora sp. WMMB334 TaxID=3404119 RepID=UPI003B93ACD1
MPVEQFEQIITARTEGKPLDPPPGITAIQVEGPMVRVPMWGGRLHPWVVTRWEEARLILSSPHVSVESSNPGYPAVVPGAQPQARGFFAFQDAPVHTLFRRALAREFLVKRVEQLRAPTERMSTRLIDAMIERGGPLDLVDALALPLPSLVICELLGVPYADHDFFQDVARTLVNSDNPPERLQAAFQELAGYIEDLVRQKQRSPGDDVLSRLTPSISDGTFTVEDAANIGAMLLFAGHETTANMISLGTVALLDHPDQIVHLHGGPAEVQNAVEELLRYLSVANIGIRRATLGDITVGGQTIRAGDGVIIMPSAVNRDDTVFSEPDELDLTRENARRHLSFGYGIHQCLGQPLARMELQTVLPALFQRLPGLRIAPGDTVRFKDQMAAGAAYLPVTW